VNGLDDRLSPSFKYYVIKIRYLFMAKNLILIMLLFSPTSFGAAKNTSTVAGRYQLIQLSDMRRDQFLLDTQTGKIWSRTCAVSTDADCSISYWSEELVAGKNTTEEQMTEISKKAKQR